MTDARDVCERLEATAERHTYIAELRREAAAEIRALREKNERLTKEYGDACVFVAQMQAERTRLRTEITELRIRDRFLDDALNTGDGSYRP